MRGAPDQPAVRVADALTLGRVVIALALIPVAWSSRLTLVAVLVSVAWVSDLLDGRIARGAGGEGRMARWDLAADTGVGAGLVIGLTGAGELPVWFALSAIVGFGTLFLAGNVAASMLLQLTGYLPLLGILWARRPPAWWVPFLVVVLVGVIDWRRLLFINIPAFVRGLTGRSGRPHRAGGMSR